MAGCFGSSTEDRYFENQLHNHLDSSSDEYHDDPADDGDWAYDCKKDEELLNEVE